MEQGSLKTFDYVVANPPFSDKRWSNGLTPDQDIHERFQHYGTPPDKQGDYGLYAAYHTCHLKSSVRRRLFCLMGFCSGGMLKKQFAKTF
jgi:type I restriction enzyme M protein